MTRLECAICHRVGSRWFMLTEEGETVCQQIDVCDRRAADPLPPLAPLEPAETHIRCWAEPAERQHDRTADCWCEPRVVDCGDTTVIDHSGAVRPSVLAVPSIDLGIGSRADGMATRIGHVLAYPGRRAPRAAGRKTLSVRRT